MAALAALICGSVAASDRTPVKGGAASEASAVFPLAPPAVGEVQLRVIAPTMLELAIVSAGGTSAPPEGTTPVFPAPTLSPDQFVVTVNGRPAAVAEAGFRRRPVYAPLKQRDLRIGNFVALRLAAPLPADATVELATKPNLQPAWLASVKASANNAPQRLSPAIHVSQIGYAPAGPKVAMVGYFLGSLGELRVADGPAAGAPEFQLLDGAGQVVHRGRLVHRPDRGMPHRWYQHVWAADFSSFQQPGEYRLAVPGLGASYPFFIDGGVPAAFARTYALGIYHQRCGAANALPYSRFTHAACHTAPATVPAGRVRTLKGFDETAADADLFPFVRREPVNVSGGHHDAGDYSKYTINSAGFIHALMTAVDTFPGAAELDNLGLPESGDGVGDLLQVVKWESDFLAKLQDQDGGFYFLVYPRDRRYEQDVLPDRGDPQIVWPKNTAGTAAAVAALAQCASSPRFRQHFPEDAQRYLAAARRGWEFLEAAQARFGDGAYRKFTHYGDQFGDADERTWAAVELFLATGEAGLHAVVRERLDPRNPDQRRWGWRRLTEAYGNATRSYGLAVKSGRLAQRDIDRRLALQCEEELVACADEWLAASRDSAYGTSYPEPTKRVSGGGWYFPLDQAFDLAVAAQLDFPIKADRRPDYRTAVWGNLYYEAGTNPVSVSFLTGTGWKRPTDIVHQFAQNDRRILPPSGIPLGTIQEGFHYMDPYRGELGALCFPLDGAKVGPYPILDRWGDSFNLQTEFVIVNQARALGVAAWLMADSPVRKQTWMPAAGTIVGVPATGARTGQPLRLTFQPPAGLDPAHARIVWEGTGQAPSFGSTFNFIPRNAGEQWVEVEAFWPDGRRAFAVHTFPAARAN